MDQGVTRLHAAYRRYHKVAAYAVAGALFACGVAVLYRDLVHPPEVNAPVVTDEASPVSTTTGTTFALATSTPTRLLIPKLSIEAEFEAPLGLNADRTVGVPKGYDTVGWYKGSAAPGSVGSSIVLGHVDSFRGAAVFYHLGQLTAGDTFSIERADGTTATFVVERLERYSQDSFPSREVYEPVPYAGIRLITCSGTYDRSTRRYSHNLVVYGRLVETTIML